MSKVEGHMLALGLGLGVRIRFRVRDFQLGINS